MPILNIQISQAGLTGVNPRIVYIQTNDTEATVLTAGYLTQAVQQGFAFQQGDMALVWTATTPNAQPDAGWYEVVVSSGVWSLNAPNSPGEVTLPTIANHIAIFTNTTGTLSEDAATAINGGNLQAGLSGTAGALISFPGTASKGSLKIAAVANTGNTITTVSNAAMGQATTVSIPDPGVSTTNFILSDSAGTQTITTGNLIVAKGNITAGSSGNAGTLVSVPPTAANGALIIQATNAGGAFNTTVASGTMGQSTVYTIPDIGAATGGVVVSTAAVRMKSVAGAAAAGGAAAQSFTDAFCTSGSCVIGNWNTQTNAASVLKIVPGNGSFVVTSSADAGVGTFNYIIMK